MTNKKFTGQTLIDMGYKPQRWFAEALEYLNKNTELTEAEVISYLENKVVYTIEPYTEPRAYYVHIGSTSELEADNIISVQKTMDIVMRTPTVLRGAIMPDACPAGDIGTIPVGGVVVTKNSIHPGMHSADICCSVMMTNFGKIDPKIVLDMAANTTHFGTGGRDRNSQFRLPDELRHKIEGNKFLNFEDTIQKARSHLGTQGDGNHFLFVGISKKTGDTILVTHHGSRGFGADLYSRGMSCAEKYRKEISPNSHPTNAWIPFETEDGRSYWEALQIVREWTKLNHTVLHDAICEKLETKPIQRFWNEHNFVFRDGEHFYHAKGSTPMRSIFLPDSEGLKLIPLNMSQPVLVVSELEAENNLGFAPHGAGRNMSRGKHKSLKGDKTDEEIFAEETKGLDVRFFSGKIDISELPSAYKSAEEIKRQIEKYKLAKIEDEIMPYGCIMAGMYNFESKRNDNAENNSN